jgi:hypothetical protein
MTRKLLWVLGALVVVPVAAATVLRLSGTALPGLGTPGLSRAFVEAAAVGDTVELANQAHARCRLLRGTAKSACYEEALLSLVAARKIRLAMATLSRIGELDHDVRRIGHDYSHVVGINAWRPGQDLGDAYIQCTELFQSGCYHGVVQVYLSAKGADSATVADLCDTIPATRTDLFLRFQCVHGIGHGMVMLNASHLPRALAGCDMLRGAWDRDSCYGGAFMEFILAGRGQSHGDHAAHIAAELAADDTMGDDHSHHGADPPVADEHAGHEMPEEPFDIRRPGDLLYPCNAVGEAYQRACYGMQAGVMVEQVGMDFAKVAAGCDGAPAKWIPSCYQGIGTYVSGATTLDAAASINHCNRGNPEYQPWCFIGVVKNFIDVTARPADGLDFCQRIESEANRVACYVAVGEQLAVLERNSTVRQEFCARLPGEAQPACRFGAGLTMDFPPGLKRPEWFLRGV